LAEFDFTVDAEGLPTSLADLLQALTQLEIAGPRRDAGVPVQVSDHCTVAASRFIQYLRDKPILTALLCEFVKPLNELETAFFALLNERSIDSAVGVQLDGIGTILNKPRNGRTDDAYRVVLRVELLVLRSNGKREELIEIVLTFLGAGFSLNIQSAYPAGVCYEIVEDISAFDPLEIAELLGRAKAGGVKLQLKYALSPQTSVFKFSSQVNAIDTSSLRGFANPGQTTGGKLRGVLVT